MRHGVVSATFVLAFALFLAALDQLAARSPAAGQVWVVTRGAAGEAMAAVLHGTQGRLLDASPSGRFVVVHVDSLARAVPPRDRTWIFLRLPAAWARLAGCG